MWPLLRVIIDLLDFVLPFTLRPLQRALSQSVPEIHHSDQGVQYLSTTYISTLISHGIEISLAHRGRPWENGYAERLIRTLKEEEVHLNECTATVNLGHKSSKLNQELLVKFNGR